MAKSAPKKPKSAKHAGKTTKASKRVTVGKTATTSKAVKGAKRAKFKAKTLAQAPVVRKGAKPTPVKTAKVVKAKAAKDSPKKGSKPVTGKSKPGKAPARKPAAAKQKPIVAVKPLATPRSSAVVKSTVVKVATVRSDAVAATARQVVVPMEPTAAPVVKPKRNASGLGVRDLQHFADLLLVKRREIVGDMHSMEGEALRSGSSGLSTLPVHMADMGTDNYEQEFTLGLVEKDRTLLREINHALAKIPQGTYGICEGTGNPIGKPRLEVQPWARHSIEYARLRERNGRGVRMF